MEHRFQVELALEFGIEEAVLIENFVHGFKRTRQITSTTMMDDIGLIIPQRLLLTSSHT